MFFLRNYSRERVVHENMNYIGQLGELYGHIQKKRGTVKCSWMNEYGKKVSTEIQFQAFWGSYQSGKERAQGIQKQGQG